MQTAPINGEIIHFVCPQCVAEGYTTDPRTLLDNIKAEEHLCYSHNLQRALTDPKHFHHPALALARPTE